MYAHLISFLCNVPSLIPCTIVCVVDDDLPASVEEVPNDLFASHQYLLPKCKSFRALSR